MALVYCYMHLRIHSYAEDGTTGRIAYINCEYRGKILRVDVGRMTEQDIANEIRFSQITPADNIIIRVRYGLGKPQFDRFMPQLDGPDTQHSPKRSSLRFTSPSKGEKWQ